MATCDGSRCGGSGSAFLRNRLIDLATNLFRIVARLGHDMNDREPCRRKDRVDERIPSDPFLRLVRAVVQLDSEQRSSIALLDEKKIHVL